MARSGVYLKRAALALASLIVLDVVSSLTWLRAGRVGKRPLPPFGVELDAPQLAVLSRLESGAVNPATVIAWERELGWCVRPLAEHPSRRIHVNARGLRGVRDYDERPAAGMLRLACFGDSFTFGDEVDDDLTFEAFLERIAPSVEALNFGVPAYGTDQALLRLQREGVAGARELAASPDPRFQSYGHLAQMMVDLYSGQFDAKLAKRRVAAARALFTDCTDDRGVAWTEFLEVFVEWMSCRGAAAAAAALRAESHARAAGDDVLAIQMRGAWGMALTFGPAPVDEALQAVRVLLERATSTLQRAEAQRFIGKLHAMRGEFEEARRYVQAGLEGMREAGVFVEAAGYSMTAAFVEKHAGAPMAAERVLREGLAELDRLGNQSYRGTTALQLADALAVRGEYDEAARWCAEVRESLNEDDLVDAISVDSLEGFLVAAAGSHAEGERLSDRALRLAAPIDFYEAKARAYEWHARTLALAGKPVEAREAAATALAIYEAKGDVPATAWARELLDSLPG